ncbi:flagellar hook-associated protein FlgK [Rhodobacteraceae bacterium RKSG542]|uniref:flagellar hook-associated protein FlgK n=1 Tax=Pseudovibrio flavus TaxID=2529854 RepID=UPI0012BD294B|nr:flagellar hook-associated protein FlgK [Pseudovibrio flavus]MTI16767.1 flagellar hook-associated protein FlgK [Pseudovibrio flavus]
MSLTSAMLTAQSSVQARAAEIAITTQNVNGANNPAYSRQTAVVSNLVNSSGSVVYVSNVSRAVNQAASTAVLNTGSVATATGSYATLLDTVCGPNSTPLMGEVATSISKLESDLQAWANDPSSLALGQTVVDSSKALVTKINNDAQSVAEARKRADESMAAAVDNINTILSDFEKLNTDIVRKTALGENVNHLLDERDEMLRVLSEEIGIEVMHRDNNDVAIYTDSGVTLFEKTAREVTFDSTATFPSGTTGNAIFVDGISVAGPNAKKPVSGGAIAGYAKMRDETGVTMQSQLDEMAKALVAAFKEVDPAGVGADMDGLFTGTDAASLSINAAVDPSLGGDINKIRDGINYDYNTGDLAGFSDRLNLFITEINAPRTFDASAGVTTQSSLKDFAVNSASWYSAERQRATELAVLDASAYTSATTTMSNSTGVHLDTELSRMLAIESAYSASAQLMTIIDNMFEELLTVAR